MSDERDNLTVEILKSIRDEIRSTNTRVDMLSGQFHEFRREMNELRGEVVEVTNTLGRHIVESETRTATAVTALVGEVQTLTTHLRSQADLRPRVERNERDIEAIKARLTAG